MKALFYVACAEIIAYLVATVITFRCIPKSISETHYMWSKKGYKYLFTAVMWLVGLPIMIYWISVSKQNLQALAFISVAAMMFVGAACAFKETLTKEVHYASAGVWAAAALAYFVIAGDWLSIVIGSVVFMFFAIIYDVKHFTFWAEISCIVMMMIGIYLL